MKQILRYLSLPILALTAFIALASSTYAAPSINFEQPTNGHVETSSSFIVSGSSTANSSIKVLVDGVQRAFVRSDGSGNWSAQLTNVGNGTHKIKAVVTSSSSDLLFTAVDLNDGTTTLNKLNQSTSVVNAGAGWPISLGTSGALLVSVVPGTSTAYASSSTVIPGNNYVAKVDTFAPGTPQAVPSYPAASSPGIVAFNLEKTKAVIANGDGTITFLDVASNSITSTISSGVSNLQSAITMSNGLVYVIDSFSASVIIVDPSTEAVNTTTSGCDGAVESLLSISPDPSNPSQYYEFCKSPTNRINIKQVGTNSLIRYFEVPHEGLSGNVSPDGEQVVLARFGAPFLDVYNSSTGTLLESVPLTDIGFVPTYSPDGQKIFIATPGSFSTNNIDVIDTTNWTKTSVVTNGIVLAGTDFINVETASSEISVNVVNQEGSNTTTQALAGTGENELIFIGVSILFVISGFMVIVKLMSGSTDLQSGL